MGCRTGKKKMAKKVKKMTIFDFLEYQYKCVCRLKPALPACVCAQRGGLACRGESRAGPRKCKNRTCLLHFFSSTPGAVDVPRPGNGSRNGLDTFCIKSECARALGKRTERNEKRSKKISKRAEC